MVANKKAIFCLIFFIGITIFFPNCYRKEGVKLLIKADSTSAGNLFDGLRIQYKIDSFPKQLFIEDTLFCSALNEQKVGLYIELRDSANNLIQNKYSTVLFLPPFNYEDSSAESNSKKMQSIFEKKFPKISDRKKNRDNKNWYDINIFISPNLSKSFEGHRVIYITLFFKDKLLVKSNAIPILIPRWPKSATCAFLKTIP